MNIASLPNHLQTQLLQDIENAGGIKDSLSTLKRICDNKEDIYGPPLSELCKKVQERVRYWQAFPEDEYYHLVATLGIQLQGTPQRTPDKVDSTLIQSSPESYATSNRTLLLESLFPESSSLTVLPPMSTMPRVHIAILPTTPHTFTTNMERDESIGPEDGMLLSLFLLASLFELVTNTCVSHFSCSVDIIISVNQHEPERNILFTVMPFHKVEDGKGDLHSGYEIILKGDIGDYIQDKYKATLVNKNEVLLVMPSCTSYSYLKSFGDAFVCLKIHNSSQYCEVSEKSHTVLQGQITNDDRRNVMLVLLCFPAGSNLTMEHYAANKVTGELNSKIMPCLATHDVTGKKVE
jgi:hypothetical protein